MIIFMEMIMKEKVKAHRLTIEYGDNEFCIYHFVIDHVNIPFLHILVLILGPNFVPW
jgi:hypothetical protein